MLAIPDFRTSEERQAWFRENADYFTCTCRINRTACTSAFHTLQEARKAAANYARDLKRPVLLYAVIGNSSEWLENKYPAH